ncbi:MAG: LPS export ABC transporter periplasmic protein LptC [bacterium]
MINNLKNWLLILPLFIFSQIMSAPLPWSKIIITSNTAQCKPQKGSKSLFAFTYKDNVHVAFVDDSKITSDILEIIFDSKKPTVPAMTHPTIIRPIITPNAFTPKTKTLDSNNKNTEMARFKSIIFKNNVQFNHINHHARADQAQLFPEQQLCKLSGNVIITQIKNKEKDVPVIIKTNVATINLVTQEVQLEGDCKKPVTTIIELNGPSGLEKKTKKTKRS